MPIPDRTARVELIRASLQTWRSSLGGGAALVLIVAAAFSAFSPGGHVWAWAGLCLAAYALQAVMLRFIERHHAAGDLPRVWAPANLLFGAVSGTLWGGLGWWLPAGATTPQLMAAMSCGMAMMGAAGSVTSMELLLAIALPGLLLAPAVLVWHAGLPLAGGVALVLGLMILRHGRAVRRGVLEAIAQRRRFDDLAERLRAEQVRLQAIEHEQALLNERQRLLRDMHDGLGASLISALMLIEQGRLSLDDAARVLRECLDDLRLVIDSLEPIEHDLATLLATLRFRLGDRLARAGIAIDWRMADVPPLPWLNAPQALDVLRIVQEALANVLKHSRAHRVLVALSVETDADRREGVCLRIEDDGIGFDATTAGAAGGRGLEHLRHRASQIGADIRIETAPGQGTRLCVRMPSAPAGASAPNQ